MSPKIAKITVYSVKVPISDGVYTMSGGRALDHYDTTIVNLETECGLNGWGEVTPLGSGYLPSYPDGARAGIKELGSSLIGEDPTQLSRINQIMDETLKGHPYAKSAIDIACWDILGKATGLPVAVLLGGVLDSEIPLYRSITYGAPDEMADWLAKFKAQGFKHFQLKVGGDVDGDIERIRKTSSLLTAGDTMVADANGGWTLGRAARIVNAIKDVNIYIEQPCVTYEECLAIRQRNTHPFVLDESIDSLSALQRALSDRAMDCVNIKISKIGGLTKSRMLRDVCSHHGIMMTIEDTACTDITASAIMALAQSTMKDLRFSVTLATVKTGIKTAAGSPTIINGVATHALKPGLGVDPFLDVLGEPVFVIN